MGGLESSPSCLELTMAIPGGFIASSPFASEGGGCNVTRDLDMNQPAAAILDEMEELGEDVVDDGDGHRPKKLRLSKEQCKLLEESFRHNHTLSPKQKETLAARLQLKPRQVEVWFQNRRARTKLKQTEMECEYLKRCFGSLTEENRRLQQEVEELRAMRAAPPTILSPRTRLPVPASALTMCPRCQRVAASAQPRRPANAASFLSAC